MHTQTLLNFNLPIITMLTASAITSTVLYFLASLMQALRMSGKVERYSWSVWLLGFFAILLHAFLLHQWIDVEGGQNLTFFNVLSQVLWIAALVVWLMSLWRPIVNLSMAIYPLAAISILLVLAFSGSYVINTWEDPKKLLHILLSFLAFSLLLIAAVQAIFLAVLDHSLRKKYSHPILQSMAPLQRMESLLFQLIALGFVILTIVIYSGIYFYPNLLTSNAWHHMVLAALAWIIFGFLLLGRALLGLRGKLAIRLCLIGVFILSIAFVTSHFWRV